MIKEKALELCGINISNDFKYIDVDFDYDEYIQLLIKEEKKLIAETLDSNESKSQEKNNNTITKNQVIYGRSFSDDIITSIDDLNEESGRVVIKGNIFHLDSKILNNGKKIINVYITDYSNSIICKLFLKEEENLEDIENKLSPGTWVRVKGDVHLDTYNKGCHISNWHPRRRKKKRKDNAAIKRTELHAHTSMSSMDGMVSATELIKRAKEWGHNAIAITDHGVVQAFPEAYEAGKKYGIKILYGVEGYLVNDGAPIVYNEIDYSFDNEYVVFDIETTGLNNVNDRITEIGAVLIKNKKIVSTFSSLINPGIPIPEKIQKLTGITNEMVSSAPYIEEILPKFLNFVGDRPLVAHNAMFDVGFIKYKASLLGLSVNNPILDTLQLLEICYQ